MRPVVLDMFLSQPSKGVLMWKILVAFVAFAALSMFVLVQSGADVDMGGEKHGVESHGDSHAASAPAAASAVEVPAVAASSASQ